MDATDIPAFRRAVRAHLAERSAVSQSAATIHRHLAREFVCTVEDTATACAVLEALGFVASFFDPLGGATRFYKATAAGIIAHERGE